MHKSAHVVECPQALSLNMCMMIYGFQSYYLSKLVFLGERFGITDWIKYQLFALMLSQFCKNIGFCNGLNILHTRGYTIFFNS